MEEANEAAAAAEVEVSVSFRRAILHCCSYLAH